MSKKIKKDIKFYTDHFKDFSVKLPWKFFVDILTKHYGCEIIKKSGSARLFVMGEIRFTAHEPHGREKFVSKDDRKRAIRYLINVLKPFEE